MGAHAASLASLGVTGMPPNTVMFAGGRLKAATMTGEQLGASYTAHQSAAGTCSSARPTMRHAAQAACPQ